MSGGVNPGCCGGMMTMSLSGAIASSSSGSYRLGKADAAMCWVVSFSTHLFFTSMLTLAIFFSHIIDVELEFIVSNIYKQHSRNYG